MRDAYMACDAVKMAQGLSHGCLNRVACHHNETQPDITEPLILTSSMNKTVPWKALVFVEGYLRAPSYKRGQIQWWIHAGTTRSMESHTVQSLPKALSTDLQVEYTSREYLE